jgi:hypothetical protein
MPLSNRAKTAPCGPEITTLDGRKIISRKRAGPCSAGFNRQVRQDRRENQKKQLLDDKRSAGDVPDGSRMIYHSALASLAVLAVPIQFHL